MPGLPKLPPRPEDSHKGDYGRALLIGGSRGMAGAIGLAGIACLRSGAGLVKLAVPSSIAATVAGYEPSYMTLPLTCDAASGALLLRSAKGELLAALKNTTAVAVGPGLGQSNALTKLVLWLYQSAEQPQVLDADALNALAGASNGLAKPGGPRILTPHPGEFARLTSAPDTAYSRAQQIARARQFAKEHDCVIVLKGHRTFITDGKGHAENKTGNPGMATGGTGDVLTGVIAALLCQGLSPLDAAVLGTHVHGLAGDLAAQELGQVSLIASDLLRYLPKAFQAVA